MTAKEVPEKKPLLLNTMDQIAIPLDQILADPKFNVRQTMDEDKVRGLAADIKARNRMLQPVIVVRNPDHKTSAAFPWKLVVGFRRYAAATLLNATKIPVEVYEGDELACYAINVAENVQREDLKPHELAQRLIFLRDRFKLEGKDGSGSKIGALVGISKSYANNLMRCEETLIPPILEAFHGAGARACPWGVDKLARISALTKDEQRATWDEFLGAGKSEGGKDDGGGNGEAPALKRPTINHMKAAISALTKAVAEGKVEKEVAKLAMSCLKFGAGLQKTIPNIYNPESPPAEVPAPTPAVAQ